MSSKKPSKEDREREQMIAEIMQRSLDTYTDVIKALGEIAKLVRCGLMDPETGESNARILALVGKMIQTRDRMDPNWAAANSFSVQIGWEQARRLSAEQAKEILRTRRFQVDQTAVLPGIAETEQPAIVVQATEVSVEEQEQEQVKQARGESLKEAQARLKELMERKRRLKK